jgi:ATP-dependent Clp protease ATP-binding subunit ClpB
VADAPAWEQVEARVRSDLRTHFRPEFLNRVDDIVVFRPLTREDLARIVELQLARLREMVTDRGFALEVAPDAMDWLATQGYDPVYGARPLKRVIQRQLQNPLALALLEGTYGEGDTVRVTRHGDGLHFERAGPG